jgi:hypothetical protein
MAKSASERKRRILRGPGGRSVSLRLNKEDPESRSWWMPMGMTISALTQLNNLRVGGFSILDLKPKTGNGLTHG